jgi:hypothetical protein
MVHACVQPLRLPLASILLLLIANAPGTAQANPNNTLRVGFAKADITPSLGEKPVWIAGYGNNRKATAIHDPLWARTCVIAAPPNTKIALVSVDLVGLQYHETLAIRQKLADFSYVLVSSTHNHEGPDVVGLWGPSRQQSGVDPDYLKLVVDRVVQSVRDAEANLKDSNATFGAADDESIVRDVRLPLVKDGNLRALRFINPETQQTLGLIVQWNCHPEHLGSKNTLITADFPHYLVKKLESTHQAPVVYFSGTLGGLMTGDENLFPKPGGGFYGDGEFEFAEAQGEAVAQLTAKALAQQSPITLTPIQVADQKVAIPLDNEGYRMARAAGVLNRVAYRWTGDPSKPGEPLGNQQIEGELALVTEVAYLRLGDLHIAAIPGEIYPELVVGKFQDPVEPNVDFPNAPLEPPVLKTLPGPKVMVIGLANDEVGYIIPKRQWDQKPPFAYGRDKPQYGEINSCGPEVAPILTQALVDCVRRIAP